MNCPNCNQPLADGRKFCTFCGCPADAPDFFDANALGTGYLDVLTKKYACFRGRARRKEYWMFGLFASIIYFSISMIPLIILILLGGVTTESPEGTKSMVFIVSIMSSALQWLYSLVIAIPELALMVRRFHDTGKSGWFAVLLCVAALILLGLPLILILIIACFDSQPGPNKYGPNLKGQ